MEQQHLHFLESREGFFYCLDVLRLDGRVYAVSGYSGSGPRWIMDNHVFGMPAARGA